MRNEIGVELTGDEPINKPTRNDDADDYHDDDNDDDDGGDSEC